jgi:hypothetical protein
VLSDLDIEAIAVRTAQLLREQEPFPRTGLVDVDQVARVLSMERSWVYEQVVRGVELLPLPDHAAGSG